MKLMAQMAMVMNLDKCIGCHTCSVTCKQAWTNRGGVEYAWFNNVETRPGQGYPRQYQDQEKWKGGWTLNQRGKLTLRAGSRLKRLLNIFANPDLPTVDGLLRALDLRLREPAVRAADGHLPVARPKSLITGKDTKVTGAPTGTTTSAAGRSRSARIRSWRKVSARRSSSSSSRPSCSTCRASASTASTRRARPPARPGRSTSAPRTASSWWTRTSAAAGGSASPAARTRRSTSTTRPARPRSAPSATRASRSASRPSARRPASAGCATSAWCSTTPTRCWRPRSVTGRKGSVPGAAGRVPRPARPARWSPRPSGPASPREWIEAAQHSPVYKLIVDYQVALPLHPEYRTMPMVWYIPPLSPMVEALSDTGHDGEDGRQPVRRHRRAAHPGGVPGRTVHRRRRRARARLLAAAGGDARAHAPRQPGREPTGPRSPDAVGMTAERNRGDVPAAGDRQVRGPVRHPDGARRADAHRLDALATGCSLDGDGGPGMTGVRCDGPDEVPRRPSRPSTPIRRGTGRQAGRVNLLNWDGKSTRG